MTCFTPCLYFHTLESHFSNWFVFQRFSVFDSKQFCYLCCPANIISVTCYTARQVTCLNLNASKSKRNDDQKERDPSCEKAEFPFNHSFFWTLSSHGDKALCLSVHQSTSQGNLVYLTLLNECFLGGCFTQQAFPVVTRAWLSPPIGIKRSRPQDLERQTTGISRI